MSRSQVIDPSSTGYGWDWSRQTEDKVLVPFKGMGQAIVVPKWMTDSRSRLSRLRAQNFDAVALDLADAVLRRLLHVGLAPRRLDPVDDEAVTFIFVKGRSQGSIDCYDTGELVVGFSEAGSPEPPRTWSFEGVNDGRFEGALDFLKQRTT